MKSLCALSASFLLCAVGIAQSPPLANGAGIVTETKSSRVQEGNATPGLKGTHLSADNVREGRPSAAGMAQCLQIARISGFTMGFGTMTPSIIRAISIVGVKDAPFSADAIYEIEDLRPESKRIHEVVHGKMFRDSQGRMRWEFEFVRNGQILRNAMVDDAVEAQVIEIDENAKVACVWRYSRASDNQPTLRFPIYGNDSEEELGTKQIEGFTAIGTRQTRSFPAGARGYAQQWVSTTEFWFSPDLKMTFVAKDESPMAKYIGRLVNPHAGEPDPSLFRLPADYRVIDSKQPDK